MATFALNPSPRLRQIVDALGGPSAAARAWGIEYHTIRRFIEGRGSLVGSSIAAIVENTKLPYEELFVHARNPVPEAKA